LKDNLKKKKVRANKMVRRIMASDKIIYQKIMEE